MADHVSTEGLEALDAIHETEFDTVGVVVLQTAFVAVVVFSADVAERYTEVLALFRIIFDTWK